MPTPKPVPCGKEQTLVIEGVSSSGGRGQGEAFNGSSPISVINPEQGCHPPVRETW